MKKFAFYLTVLLCASSSLTAGAQEVELAPPDIQPQLPIVVQQEITPEMYLAWQRMQREDERWQAVRRNAEIRAAQRQQRLAAAKWFGVSNSRPQASPTPLMGTYSHYWAASGPDPYRWSVGGYPTTIIYIQRGVRY